MPSISGGLPLEVLLHKNAFTTFVYIIRQKGSIENDIALGQIVMKDENVKSWFMFVRGILKLYSLPSIFQLLDNPPSKNEWKRLLNSAVNTAMKKVGNKTLKVNPLSSM